MKAPNPSMPMEISSHLTLHGSWSWETKNIVTTCKTNGERNHIVYLHSSICGCKGLHKGGYLQTLHIQDRTCVLNLKIDHTITINETSINLYCIVQLCPTITVEAGGVRCFWFGWVFYMYTRNTPNPSDIHVNQHAMLAWNISWLRERNLIRIHWADMTDCLIKDTAISPRTMKLCIVMLTVTENNDNHCHFFSITGFWVMRKGKISRCKHR